MNQVLPALALTITLLPLAAGCSKKETPTEAETTPVTRPDSVGIAECDAYLDKYESCLRGANGPASGATQAFKAQRESFKIAAATPEGKVGLKATCKSMLDKLATDKVCAGK